MTKIGKLSVFSGLNNLRDISMLPEYSDICGISETDLHNYFTESTLELAKVIGINEEECYRKLKEMYDGYHFSEDSEGMYNPFSLLNTFASRKFNDPIPLLYQSGYLTIKGYDPMFGIYILGFPNKEVKKGFMKMLLSNYAPLPEKEGNVLIARLYRAVT